MDVLESARRNSVRSWFSNGHSLQRLLSSGECHCMCSAVLQELAATIAVVTSQLRREMAQLIFTWRNLECCETKWSTAKASIRNSHLHKGSRSVNCMMIHMHWEPFILFWLLALLCILYLKTQKLRIMFRSDTMSMPLCKNELHKTRSVVPGGWVGFLSRPNDMLQNRFTWRGRDYFRNIVFIILGSYNFKQWMKGKMQNWMISNFTDSRRNPTVFMSRLQFIFTKYIHRDDVGRKFLWNVDVPLKYCTVSHHRRRKYWCALYFV